MKEGDMGPRFIERTLNGSVALCIEGVSIKDGRLVSEMIRWGDNCPEGGEKVMVPIEKSLVPLVESGQEPKHLLVIVCEDREMAKKYLDLVNSTLEY